MALVFAPWFLCSIVVRRFSSCSQRNQCVRHAGASAARRSCIILELYERARWSALAQAAPSSTDTCGPPTLGIGARARVLEVRETSSTSSRRVSTAGQSHPSSSARREAAQGFRRLQAHRQLPLLRAASTPIATRPPPRPHNVPLGNVRKPNFNRAPGHPLHSVSCRWRGAGRWFPSDQSGTPPISQVGPEPIQNNRGPASSADQKCHMGGAPEPPADTTP